METLALLLVVPIAWPFIAKAIWKHELTVREMAINLAVGIVLASGVWSAGRYAQTYDVEILNGQVISKEKDQVSCDHSYSCNCKEVCSGSGQNRSCSTTCDTCYEHSYDYDWVLNTSLRESIKIARVDRQGLFEPERYRRAQPGDPVAMEHSFTNYRKASATSLFNSSTKVPTTLPIPRYPNKVYDYHYVNRALTAGVTGIDFNAWNRDIANTLRVLGPMKEANLVVVFAKTEDPMYADALEQAWAYGKKNDVIVVIGTMDGQAVSWVRVISWTDNQMFKVALRDRLMEMQTIDREPMMKAISEEIKAGFKRKPNKDFEYLAKAIEPPGWVIFLAFFLSAAASIGLSVYFSRNSETTGGYASVRRSGSKFR